jgi:hypothetical protein
MKKGLGVLAVFLLAIATTGRIPVQATEASGRQSSVAAQKARTQAPDETDVLALDQTIADAVIRGDTGYVAGITSTDFVMVHGDGWTNGGQPLSTDTKDMMLDRVASKYYDVLDFDSVKAEMHGDIAITYGRYIAHRTVGAPDNAWFSVWFERVYAKRNGRWTYLSHRTVHGPTYGAERRSVSNK